MKNMWLMIAMLVPALHIAMPSIDRKPLGEVDFFGYKGLDLAAIRTAVPFHEGDLFPPVKAKSADGR